ncbi:MAG: GNAT family N-acetyltransferase [Nannocystaceae bacterium]
MIHRLRPAESSDFDWLLALHRQGRVGDDPARVRAEATRAFATRDVQVVEVDGEPVGTLAVDWDRAPVVLQSVEVTPGWQGRGLGTRLVHDVLLEARQRGVAVEAVLPAEAAAMAMLRRLGMWPVEGEVSESLARLRWEAGPRTDVTLEAAMSPWADAGRRRAWAVRLFEASAVTQVDFVRFVAGRHGVPDDAAVLDVHAGTGRRLRSLAAGGWRVTALESDADLRAAAEHVARVAGQGIEVRPEGLDALADDAAYDLILALDAALWTLPTHEARVDAARRLRRALRPSGVLVLQGPNAPALLRAGLDRPARTELYHRARVSQLPRLDVDVHDAMLDERETYVVEVEGHEVAEWTDRRRLALLSRPLLEVALRQAGWQPLETYPSLAATGPGRLTSDLLWVAERVG